MTNGVNWGLAAQSAQALGGLYDAYQSGLRDHYNNAARNAIAGPQEPNFLQRIVGQITGQGQDQQQPAAPSFIQQIAAPSPQPPAASQNVRADSQVFAPPPQTNSMFADQPSITTAEAPQRPQQLQPTPNNGVIDRIINVESGGNPNAANPRSTAVGPGQFITTTWLSMIKKHRPDLAAGRSDQELLALRKNPDLSYAMTQAYAQENGQNLQNAGFQNTPGNTYLSHFAGPAGATAILRANPNAPVGAVLGPEVVRANPFLANMNAGQLRQWADAKMNGANAGDQQQLPPNAAPAQAQAQQAFQFSEKQLRAMLMSPEYAPVAIQYLNQMRQQGNTDREHQFRERDFQLRERQFNRGEIPAGFEVDPENPQRLRPRGGGPLDPNYIQSVSEVKAKPLTLGPGDVTKLSEEGGKFQSLMSFSRTFENRFAGRTPGTGDFQMAAGRYVPGWAGKDNADAATFWQGYDRYKNQVRNDLFGSALTATEQAAFEKADINPSMDPGQIKKNIAEQERIVRAGIARKAGALVAGGYDPRQVAAAYGLQPQELGVDPNLARRQRDQDTLRGPAQNAPRINTREEMMRLAPGTVFVGPDGQRYQAPGR